MDGLLPAYAGVRVGNLGPDDEHISYRRIGDPHLGTVQLVASVHRFGAGDHTGGVAAVVRLGQAKAAHPFAGGQLGQVLLPLLLAAVLVDRVHHQRALYADGAAVAAVYALHLAGYEAVAHVVQARAAIALDGAAQKAHGPGFVHDLAVKLFVPRGHQHAGLQLFLAKGVRGILHGAFVVAQLLAQEEGVLPVEFCFCCHECVQTVEREVDGWAVCIPQKLILSRTARALGRVGLFFVA